MAQRQQTGVHWAPNPRSAAESRVLPAAAAPQERRRDAVPRVTANVGRFVTGLTRTSRMWVWPWTLDVGEVATYSMGKDTV